jgi:hypothetical protein
MDLSGRRTFIDGKITVVRMVMGSNRRKDENVALALFTD